MKKVKLNTEWLSVCGGCHVAIVDLHEKILDVLGAVDVQHSPVLTDIKDYPKADVGIVTGAIRNEHDRHNAIQMRKSCDLIIAFGTCAVYGGIPGAGTVHSSDDLMHTAYTTSKTTHTTHMPSERVDRLSARVTPIDEVINVDLYLPGCPPHANFIFEALTSLVKGKSPKVGERNVCAACKRKMMRQPVTAIKNPLRDFPDRDTCLMCQGYICLGSVTLDRCLAPCPNTGVACTGCAGPSIQVLREPNRDLRTEVAQRMSRLTEIPADDIVRVIERGAKNYYSYAMASGMIGQKPTFLIKKWIADVEETA
ncbi:MAG: methyl viologen-reducing hydrogenase [Deltaproteobacteria bacterium]|nr:methyl viologen-reducing hydrogenase [Deltaproteobacteria bacterium]